MIIEAAITLFCERGYSKTSTADIGAAVGISGPAVYRHFASKDKVLEAALSTFVSRMFAGPKEAEAMAPAEALRHLVESYARLSVTQSDWIALWYQDQRNLSDDIRHRTRRLHRQFLDVWVRALMRARPELDPGTARATVNATVSLLNSAAHYRRPLEAQPFTDLLIELALRTLAIPVA